MEKNEVIVDTCFLQKLSAEGKRVENIKRVLSELAYIPVVHPYVYEHELALYSYYEGLVKEGYLRVSCYNEFQRDACEKELYEAYFSVLYEELRQALEAIGSSKAMVKLELGRGQTIYNIHRQGSNIGDVHLMLMAAFLRLPIILTEDSDIDLLRSIAKRRMPLGSYSLQILNGIDLVKLLAQKVDCTMSVKEIEAILNEMGERKYRTEVKDIWRKVHAEKQ